MEKYKLLPLSRQEKEFAEVNHNLIYSFLHSQRCSIDDCYDIVVFGYLQAVQNYLRKESLRKYTFSTVAFMQMSGSLSHYYSGLSRQKIMPEKAVLSLDAERECSDSGRNENLYNLVSQSTDFREDIHTKYIIQQILDELSDTDKGILLMKIEGYTQMEIAQVYGISHQSVSLRLKNTQKRMRRRYGKES